MYPISNSLNSNQSNLLDIYQIHSSSLFNYSFYNNLSLFNSFNLSNSSSIINDVRINEINEEYILPINTSIVEQNDDNLTTEFNDRLALFYLNKNLIKVPSKILRTLQRHTPKHLLYAIHNDITVAIELCLLFTTQLTSTYFEVKDGDNISRWKSLRAEYLRELLLIDTLTYKRVIEALEHPLANGAIIECDHHKVIGEKNHFYRLGSSFIAKGIVGYELKTKEAQRLLNKHYFRIYADSNQNIICKNLIRLYSDIQLPTIEQIKKEAQRLIKLGYKTKKDKKLTFLNKHSRDYYKDADSRSFVEDAVEIYKYLTSNGLMIPMVGSEKSGGRIVDSFTLMPGWIRNLVKINGKVLIECDYAALHPNIAMKLYGGKSEYITHGDIANELNLDLGVIKLEHLSFFNKKVWAMKESPLFDFYSKHEPIMLQSIINEKYDSEFKHKMTSRRMFKLEVEIMTSVIEQLNDKGIYMLYVYDALLCHPKHSKEVLQEMNSIILSYGVKTTAKCTSGKKHNPIAARLKETSFDLSGLIKPTNPVNLNSDRILIDMDELCFSIPLKEKIYQTNTIEELNFIDAYIDLHNGEPIKEKVLKIENEINPQFKYMMHRFFFEPLPLDN